MFIWGSFDVLKVFPIEFSRSSHQVPNVFPEVFPNSITVLPHLICPKLSGDGAGAVGGKGVREAPLCIYFGECPKFQKKKR